MTKNRVLREVTPFLKFAHIYIYECMYVYMQHPLDPPPPHSNLYYLHIIKLHTQKHTILHFCTYRMAGNFRGMQFSRKAHLQRFRDLIFADGRSRVAPPTISVRLHLLPHARRGSNLIGIGRKNQQAIDRSYLYLAEIEKWYESIAYD